MNFTRALFLTLVVLFFHAIALIFNLYGLLHWFDIPMHFAGGLAMGSLGIAIWQEGIHEVKFKGWLKQHLEWWFVPLFVVSFAALIGVGWEIFEFILDQFFTGSIDGVYQTLRQPSVADTMLDLLLDLVGGASAVVLFWWLKIWR